MYSIKNTRNKNEIYPIGSTCIKKFERDDLNEKISVREKMFQLLHAIEDKKFITLTSEFFSRKLLAHFNEEGVFEPNEFNDYNSEKDYEFMLDMFNKKTKPTDGQKKTINVIIIKEIKPYLNKILDSKIRKY